MAVPFLAHPDSSSPAGSSFPSRRPLLIALEGGRSPRALAERNALAERRAALRHRTFVQRRIFVAVVAVLALASVASVVSSLAGPSVAGTAVASSYHVGAGDTLWSIAGSLDLDLDRRVAVQLLAEANGGTEVRAGEEIVIPAELNELAG